MPCCWFPSWFNIWSQKFPRSLEKSFPLPPANDTLTRPQYLDMQSVFKFMKHFHIILSQQVWEVVGMVVTKTTEAMRNPNTGTQVTSSGPQSSWVAGNTRPNLNTCEISFLISCSLPLSSSPSVLGQHRGQKFSDLGLYKDHLRSLGKCRHTGLTSRDADSLILGWGLGICRFHQLAVNSDVVPHLEKLWILRTLLFSI